MISLLLVRSPLAAIAAAGMLGALVLFCTPMAGLTAVIFACGLLTWSPFQTGIWSRLYPGNVAIGVFLAEWTASHLAWGRKRFFQPSAINPPLFGLAVAIVLSMLWSRLFPDARVAYRFPHSGVSWATTQVTQLGLLVATACMPFAVAAAIRSWKDVEKVILSMGVVASLGTLVTILALLVGFGSSYSVLGFRRAYWNQPWHSSVQPLAAWVLPFLCSGALSDRPASVRRIIRLLFALCLVGVVLTFSRESWALATIGLVMVTALRLRKNSVTLFAFLTTASILLCLLAPGSVTSIARFYNPRDAYGLDRIYYWKFGVHLFETHPLLGVGAGNYQFFDRAYGTNVGGTSHNQFITLAAETGVLGISMLLWLLCRLLRIRKPLNLRNGWEKDPHFWVKAASSVFLLLLPVQFFFGESLLVSAAAAGGTFVLTNVIFNWILVGIVLVAFDPSRAAQWQELENATAASRKACVRTH
jgi:O-antigen ligase